MAKYKKNYGYNHRLLAKRHTGYTRDEIATKLGMTSGGTFSKMLEALAASDFIVSYHPFGFSQKEIRYKLTDSFCQFYLRFVDGQHLSDDSFLQGANSHTTGATVIQAYRSPDTRDNSWSQEKCT